MTHSCYTGSRDIKENVKMDPKRMPLTTPELSTLLRYSRKPSSLISWSVNTNVMPLPYWPDVRYRNLRSSSRLDTLYDLMTGTQGGYSSVGAQGRGGGELVGRMICKCFKYSH